ncbi:GDSL-type esterase/lipase family protein [Clostridium sp.]|jgi:acyl-CoA thioesterase I|uniref:GDSL-type esterase/lipase family protein n=1 Tax=Clostridium sp. TaxID=1506 RepID=UPI0039F55C1E
MKIVCIGDSLTYGYMVNNPNRWTQLCENKYNITFLNKGKLGDTTAGMMYRFYEDVVLEKPGIGIIMGGTNDFLMSSNLNKVEDNIMTMIEEGMNNNINMALGIQPPVIPSMAETLWAPEVDYKIVNEKLSYYRDWCISFSKEMNIPYIDFYNKIKSQINMETLHELYIDGIHVNIRGHKLMAEAVFEVLNSII